MANLEDLIDPEYGLQQDEWSLTRPRFGAEGQLEVIGWSGRRKGDKYYILKCSKCSEDSELFGGGCFKTHKKVLNRGSIPCGCSRRYLWTQEEYILRCRRLAASSGCEFISFTEEFSGLKTEISINCPSHGIWKTSLQNFLSKVKRASCRICGHEDRAKDRRMHKDARQESIVKLLEKKHLHFIGFIGEYRNRRTPILVKCLLHGEFKTTVNSVCKGYGCLGCAEDVRREKRTIPEDVMIQKFMASGQFEEGTKFVKVGSRNKKAVWEVFCPSCETSGISTLDNLQQGKRPCSCGTARQKEAYINFVKEESAAPIAVKFGIANNSEVRLLNQNSRCIYEVENFGVWEFETKKSCLAAERECKQTLECGVLTKEEMPDGFTESTWVYNLDKIISIYEKHGGKRIK